MTAPFRENVARSLESEQTLINQLRDLSAQDWQPIAELFAAKLPEFDAVIAMPGAEPIAAKVAAVRGVPDLTAGLTGKAGELVIFAAHLLDGQAEQQVVQQAAAAGWKVLLVATAVERTNKGARALLADSDIPVRAVTQVADTPTGLVFERRTPDRWTV